MPFTRRRPLGHSEGTFTGRHLRGQPFECRLWPPGRVGGDAGFNRVSWWSQPMSETIQLFKGLIHKNVISRNFTALEDDLCFVSF